MSTPAQIGQDIHDKLDCLWDEYYESIGELNNIPKHHTNIRWNAIKRWHELGERFFNLFEKAARKDFENGHQRDSFLQKDLPDDALGLMDVILDHYTALGNLIDEMKPERDQIPFPPSRASFANAQGLVKLYHAEAAPIFRERFAALNLPTLGFDRDWSSSPWKERDMDDATTAPTLSIDGDNNTIIYSKGRSVVKHQKNSAGNKSRESEKEPVFLSFIGSLIQDWLKSFLVKK